MGEKNDGLVSGSNLATPGQNADSPENNNTERNQSDCRAQRNYE